MRVEVRGPREARDVVERFNAFHDGFIRELELSSHDTFEDRHTHATTGRLDLRILFAHSNYDLGRPPHDRLVEARFFEVRDLMLRFTGRPEEWPIDRLEVAGAEDEIRGGRLAVGLVQPRLADGARWERVETLAFTCSYARFEELPGASD